MEIYKKYSIDHIDNILVKNYNAIEIDGYDLLNNINYSGEEINDIIKTYKIEDEYIINNMLSINEKEELKITADHLNKNQIYGDEHLIFDDMQKIITGKLIVLMLESEDNIHFSGFIMHGNGEKLYNYLTELIGNNLEKNTNSLEETINELNNFRPYGKYL